MTTRGLSIDKPESPGIIEPVDTEDLKRHLAIDSDTWLNLLNILLSSARQEVEKYTGLSLIVTDMTVRWEELTTQELPYGPVISLTSVKDKDGEDITTHTIEGLIPGFATIKADSETPVIVKYKAGYTQEIPALLKLAIIKCASDHFTHRTGITLENANGAQSLPNDWKKVAINYSKSN